MTCEEYPIPVKENKASEKAVRYQMLKFNQPSSSPPPPPPPKKKGIVHAMVRVQCQVHRLLENRATSRKEKRFYEDRKCCWYL